MRMVVPPKNNLLTIAYLNTFLLFVILLLTLNKGAPTLSSTPSRSSLSIHPPARPLPANPARPIVRPMAPPGGPLRAMSIIPNRLTSQGGQDGVIASIQAAIGEGTRFFVEFGFNSDGWLGTSGPNAYQLHLQGWKGLLLDGGHENLTINLRKHFLFPENICDLFHTYEVPLDLGYLSVDVDTKDLWLLQAILNCNFRPRLVSVEYNSNHAFDSCVTLAPWASNAWHGGDRIYGTSLKAVRTMAAEFNYDIVFVEKLLDVFLVPHEVLVEHGFTAPPFETFKSNACIAQHFAVGADRADAAFGDIVDFCVWRETGDVQAAIAAARASVEGQGGCPKIVNVTKN